MNRRVGKRVVTLVFNPMPRYDRSGCIIFYGIFSKEQKEKRKEKKKKQKGIKIGGGRRSFFFSPSLEIQKKKRNKGLGSTAKHGTTKYK